MMLHFQEPQEAWRIPARLLNKSKCHYSCSSLSTGELALSAEATSQRAALHYWPEESKSPITYSSGPQCNHLHLWNTWLESRSWRIITVQEDRDYKPPVLWLTWVTEGKEGWRAQHVNWLISALVRKYLIFFNHLLSCHDYLQVVTYTESFKIIIITIISSSIFLYMNIHSFCLNSKNWTGFCTIRPNVI